jgi:hypothetical protein
MHSVSRTAKKLGAAVALSFAMAMPAAAADINTYIISGANQASDENREYLIDRVRDGVGVVSVGDSLRGFINFNTINSGGANLGGATGVDEFTGVFQVLVIAAIVNPIDPTQLLVQFGPDPAFVASLAAMGIISGPGTIAALFTDPSVDFCADFTDGAHCAAAGPDDGTAGRTVPPSSADVSTGLVASEEALGAFATDGQLWATIGFTGPPGTVPGEGIAGFGPVSILAAFGLTSGSSAGNINAGLNLLTIGPGFDPSITINRVTPSPFGDCDPAPGIQVGSCTVDFALSQQLRGVADLDTPFEISTNTNVSFNATRIPEPSTLLLLGGALAILGWSTRRRNAGV